MTHAITTLRTGLARFRHWRRGRPFWGGAIVAAAGVELLVAPAAQSLVLPIDLIIHAGVAGISGNLIGALLIGIGVLSWFQPAQNAFFGMVAVMLALVSFVTSNFGGFVIGMLLGIVGGALVFAWGPDARRRSAASETAPAERGAGEPDGTDGGARNEGTPDEEVPAEGDRGESAEDTSPDGAGSDSTGPGGEHGDGADRTEGGTAPDEGHGASTSGAGGRT